MFVVYYSHTKKIQCLQKFCAHPNTIISSFFNIFKMEDLKKAVAEMYRVLKPHGRLVMSDPICEQPMNETLRNDDRLRGSG